MSTEDTEPTVWRMLLGSKGAFESEALEEGLIFVGFGIHTDLSNANDEKIRDIVNRSQPRLKPGQRGRNIAQLRMFARQMKQGDLVVVALKTKIGELAIGRVSGDYVYDSNRTDVPHTRQINWVLPSMPISPAFTPHVSFIHGPNTLNAIGDQATCEKARYFANTPSAEADALDSSVEEDTTELLDLGAIAKTQIAQLIHERFPEKKLEDLVAGVLQAEGYTIAPSVGSADQGVDVLAGHGLFGFDPPLVCVQVKHEQGATRAPAVQQLRGAIEDFGAQQGLFVSWGGYTRDAERTARRNFFKLRLWYASDLIEAVCRNYNKLSAGLRAEIPLQQIWVVAPDDSNE